MPTTNLKFINPSAAMDFDAETMLQYIDMQLRPFCISTLCPAFARVAENPAAYRGVTIRNKQYFYPEQALSYMGSVIAVVSEIEKTGTVSAETRKKYIHHQAQEDVRRHPGFISENEREETAREMAKFIHREISAIEHARKNQVYHYKMFKPGS